MSDHHRDLVLQETEKCVQCGLCLPYCPTYKETLDEGDSPRGRIALMRGYSGGGLALSDRLEFHLDRCLDCRACERVCPAGVGYGQAIDHARAMIYTERRGAPWSRRLLTRCISDARWRAWLRRGLTAYQKSGLRWLARHSGLLRLFGLRTYDELLPPLLPSRPLADRYPARGPHRGTVVLFRSCADPLFEPQASMAAVTLLTRLGYTVHLPPGLGCCGALHLHQGDTGTAEHLARQNIAAVNAVGADALLYTASGCGATLHDYRLILGDHTPGFTPPLREMSDFLAEAIDAAPPPLAPLDLHVAVHDPCTLHNVLRIVEGPYRLLRRIPGLRVTPLPGNPNCCGAAGSYMLHQPQMARALRADKLAALQGLQPDILVSSNIGCILHLAAGARAAGLNIEITYPWVLLARQLRPA